MEDQMEYWSYLATGAQNDFKSFQVKILKPVKMASLHPHRSYVVDIYESAYALEDVLVKPRNGINLNKLDSICD